VTHHRHARSRIDLVGEYKIIRVLGSGGFGNTYLAVDHNLSREVAIKEFFRVTSPFARIKPPSVSRARSSRTTSSGVLDRFVQEAKLLAKFRHPNIVRVFRTFEANHTSYIVLDYVRRANVEAWLQRLKRRPTQQELDELVAPLTDALALLLEAKVLHRDIKPANICIREETGDPVLLDFGASKYSMSEMTGTTAAIVSRGYSPYEAYASDSKQQGAWTDIYALGATLYRALTDGPPPEATERLLNDTIVPLRSQPLQGCGRSFSRRWTGR
jgi:serine/threonine protein kinase